MKESFILYKSFYEPIKEFSDEEKGQLLDAIFQYNSGENLRKLSPVCQVAFNFMKSQFDRDNSKYKAIIERNKNNGKKGGRPPKEQNPEESKKPSGLIGMPEEPKKADTDTVTDTATDKKENNKKKTNVFIPPALFEIQKYFSENGYSNEAAEKAFKYYDSANWKDSNGKQVNNWKQKMIAVWFKPENKITEKPTNGYSIKEKTFQAL